jgi:hypothetical protein
MYVLERGSLYPFPWEGYTRVGPCANTRIKVRVQLWSIDLTNSIGLLLSITVGPILPGEGTGAATAGWEHSSGIIIAVRASAAVVTELGNPDMIRNSQRLRSSITRSAEDNLTPHFCV